MDDEWQSLAETTRRWGKAMIEKRIAITKDETVSVICHESVREIVESKLEVLCSCGDEIVAGDGARCGTCVAVKYREKGWADLTATEIKLLRRAANNDREFAALLIARFKEKNT